MKAPRETDLVNACLELLAIRGIMAWRNNTGATKVAGRCIRFGHPGSADILGCLPPSGRLLAVECKMPGGKLRPNQAVFLDSVRMAGGLALVVRDVAELDAALAGDQGAC